jgi:hypothetical protein
MTWQGHVALKGKKENTYRILVGKYECKRLLEISRYRREDTIKIDLKEIGGEGMDWLYLA